ncbi:hypothetical protein QLX67_05665 [Balneolaceae bacterium ANBcel3]|nr:hypothetical protein [Balneolaceae bacterium ANBcel3]
MKWTESVLASTDSEAVIILGMGPQALYMLRTLNQTGKRVFLIGPKSYYGYLSRYGKKLVCEDDESMNRQLNNLLDEYGDDTPIMISGGSSLNFALSHLDDAKLNIYPKPFSNLKTLNQKLQITNWLFKHPILNEFGITNYLWNQMPKQVSFPVLAKWNSSTVNLFKTKVLTDSKDWEEFSLKYVDYAEELVFQPYIENKRLYHLGGWFQNGQLNEHILVEEVRQNPVGMVSYLKNYEERYSEAIRNFIDEVMRHFQVTGFVQFEFIEDVTSRKLYFLECNARPWGSMDALNFRSRRASGAALNLLKDLSNRKSSAGITERIMSCLFSDILHFRWSDPLPLLAPLFNQLRTNDKKSENSITS